MAKRSGSKKVQVTSIELPDELYRQLKIMALDEKTTFKAVVQRALEQYVARRGAAKVK